MGLIREYAAEWALLQAHVPVHPIRSIGVLLRQGATLHAKVLPDWVLLLPDQSAAEVWRDCVEEIIPIAENMGAKQTLDWLEEIASHGIQLGPRHEITVNAADVASELTRLYEAHVAPLDTRVCVTATRDRIRMPVYGALAAGLIAAAVLLHTHSRSSSFVPATHDSKIWQQQETLAGLTLPSTPPILDMDLRVTRAHKRSSKPVVKKRGVTLAMPRVHAANAAIIIPEPPHVSPPSWSSPDELLAISMPEPPRLRQRRNRAVRLLAIVTTPFRTLLR